MKTIGVTVVKTRFLILAFGLIAAALGAQAQAQVVVIANPGFKAAGVSRTDLRDVFTGASSSLNDGSPVTPVLLKSGPVNDAFLTLYVGKSDSAFRTLWRGLLFSGQGVLPHTLETDAEVVDYVAHTPWAIGYIAQSTPHAGVKTLSVR